MRLLSLAQLIQPLNQEGFLTRLVEADESIDVEQLFVLLDDEDPELTWQLQMMFISQVQSPTLLQFVTPLAMELGTVNLDNLSRFLLKLNTKLLISGFELNEAEEVVYYRFLLPCLDTQLDPTLIVNTIWMISYQLDRFAPLVKEMITTNSSFEQACEQLKKHLSEYTLTAV
jgi:hypothetical protein